MAYHSSVYLLLFLPLMWALWALAPQKYRAGVLLGEFTDCTAADPTYALTLDEIFSELLLPLGKPVLGGIRAGHCNPKITIPLGVAAEMDVGRQTLRLLRGAVEPR